MKIEGYYTVTSLNTYIKMVLENDANLRYLSLRAEISSFKRQTGTGHCYITLKDEHSSISAIMFASQASNLTFSPKEGDDVLITGKVSSYPQRGQYQVYIYEMSLFGQGQQLLELEKLKKKLAQEGLFDESRKRLINRYPHKIGIITAKNSAASADMIKNISRRYPICEIYLFSSLVQGEDAPKDLLRAFNLSQEIDLDTLIIGRGGGSNEDLSAFNDESLVRAVACSKMPVISAVGHEIDVTLIDYVADKRASTPTGAAEFATVDQEEIRTTLIYSEEKMVSLLKRRIENYKYRLNVYKSNNFFVNPASMYQESQRDVKELSKRLKLAMGNFISYKRQEVLNCSKRLDSLNPRSVLNRGYSLVEDENGVLITSLSQLKEDQIMKTSLKDGYVISKIKEIKKEN